jgi:hypothetical protein
MGVTFLIMVLIALMSTMVNDQITQERENRLGKALAADRRSAILKSWNGHINAGAD